MGKGCLNASKYFLFLFNLISFLFGVAILGFGLWLLLDDKSFIMVLHESTSVKVGCYILIGVGGFSMLLGFVGCLGAIYENRCLLGLYFACLLLILGAQIAAGVLIYVRKEDLNSEMSNIIGEVLDGYPGNYTTTEQAWDYIQGKMKCCGWEDQSNWVSNQVIRNNSQMFPCSCQNVSVYEENVAESGFCVSPTAEWPVYDTGCSDSVDRWLVTNMGVVLGICVSVAFIELLGMVLSICMCRNIPEVYSKVPKY